MQTPLLCEKKISSGSYWILHLGYSRLSFACPNVQMKSNNLLLPKFDFKLIIMLSKFFFLGGGRDTAAGVGAGENDR